MPTWSADLVTSAAVSAPGEDGLDDALLSVVERLKTALDVEAAEERQVARHELRLQAWNWLNAGRPPGPASSERKCFHWPLEFPEVFARGGFDSVIGNPPFQGGKKISGALGEDYRRHLVDAIAAGRKGNADLIAYFLLRAASLASRLALLATDAVSQGQTREVGLDPLVAEGWVIYRAVKSQKWPGAASVQIAKLWLQNSHWEGARKLDDQPVVEISPLLDPAGRVHGAPKRLAADGVAFQGSNLACGGFVLSTAEAEELLRLDPRNADVVRPYLGGKALNTNPEHDADRYVIDFRDWPLAKAREYPLALDVLASRVKPEVERKAESYRGWVDRWWQFWNPRAQSYRLIEPMERIIAVVRVSSTLQPVFVPTGRVFDVGILIFAYDDDGHFGLLTSGLNWWWVVTNGSKHGVAGDPRYTATGCFETLPQPTLTPDVENQGNALDEHRRALMRDRDEGLTKVYNRVHDPEESAADIVKLRGQHVALDHAVCEAYGWGDLDLGHDFVQTHHNVRYTFPPMIRIEILDRLLELNHARYNEEVAAGLHGNKGKPVGGDKAEPSNPAQESLL